MIIMNVRNGIDQQTNNKSGINVFLLNAIIQFRHRIAIKCKYQNLMTSR